VVKCTVNLNINFNFMFKAKILITALVVLVFVVILSTVGIAVYSYNSSQKRANDQEILSKISRNNPNYNERLGSFTANATGAGLRENSALDSKLIAPGYPYPIVDGEFNYYYTKTTATRGGAFNSCNYGYDQSQFLFVPTSESFNFNDGSNFYSKYSSFNSDGSLNSLTISKSKTSDTTYEYEDITYLGGSYAVRTTSKSEIAVPLPMPIEEPQPLPSEEPVTKEMQDTSVSTDVSSTTSIFGDNANIIRTENINGKDYYVIQYSYEADCLGNTVDRWAATTPNKSTIYTLSYASVDTYEILKTETYLNSVSESNLMERYETLNQRANIEFSSIASNFEFNFNVPIKDIDYNNIGQYPEYDANAEVQKAINFAKDENITLLLPETGESQYVYLNYAVNQQPVPATNHYGDRSFYPVGAIGDQMFNSYNGIVNTTLLNTSTSLGTVTYANLSTENSYNLNIYSQSEDDRKILNGFLYSSIRNQNESQVQVSVNGVLVDATLYSYESDQPDFTILPYSTRSAVDTLPVEESACTQDCFKKDYILIFSFNNNKYALQEYNYSRSEGVEFEASDAIFKSLSSSVESEFVQIRTLIENSMKGTVSGSAEPYAP
jgi:hypothetical protein